MKVEGLRVVRGPNWKWGDQDGGEGSVGTVVGFKKEGGMGGRLSELFDGLSGLGGLSDLFSQKMSLSDDNKKRSGIVKVVWDCGIQADYRAGFEGHYDLLIVDDAAAGVKHQNTPCHLCDVPEIVGMRWECSECQLNFCSPCFYQMENLHEHFNAFKRYTSDDSKFEPYKFFVDMPGKRLHLRGIFPGAKVERGRDWSYGNEDGGQPGDVMPTAGSTLRDGKVDVKWRSDGITVTYRRGGQGKMELKAVEAGTGGRYHPEWLPALKVITEEESMESSVERFYVGDRVRIVATVTEMREKQAGHGGWTESMEKAIGETGTVFKVDSDGDLHIKFEKMNQMWCLNPTFAKKLTRFSVNQMVRVRDDMCTLNAIRTQFGSDGINVTNAMAGETGRITKVEMDEDSGERVHLELMNECSYKPTPAMKPEWLEAVPVAFKLHEKLSKMKTKMGNLFVQSALECDLYILRELLENFKMSVDVDHKSTPGLTALHLACQKGRLQIVKWLLDKNANIEKADDKGRTALYHAVKGGEEAVLQLLIKNGADKDIKTKTKGLTALQKAIAKKQTKCAKILIENECDVNHQDQDGDTPLHNAIHRMKDTMVLDGALTVFDALVNSKNVDINIRNEKGFSVFHVAVGFGNLRIVQYFLSLGNAPDFVLEMIPKKLLNPLHIACMKGYLEIAKILLDYVINLDEVWTEKGFLNGFINARDTDEQTPLMMASMTNHYPLIELLVNAGADINLKDQDGDTAISIIMRKVGNKEQSKSPTPTSDSAAIHGLYEALCSSPISSEAIAKHPALAAVCYLISNGGDPEAGEALTKSSDAVVNTFLRSFVPEDSNITDNSRIIVDQGTLCTLCGRSSPPVLYNCCNKENSLFCSDCSQEISLCPCCKNPIQRPGMVIAHSPSHSIDLRDSDVSVSSPIFINFPSPSTTESEGSEMQENIPHSPSHSIESGHSDAVPISPPKCINKPSPSVTASDESQIPENDDDTVMEASESSQSSVFCDQPNVSTSDSVHLQAQSPSKSQLANYDGTSEAVAGTSKDISMEVDYAGDSGSSCVDYSSGSRVKTKNHNENRNKRSCSSDKHLEKESFKKGKK